MVLCILALGLYLHSEVQICVSDALSISSCFQSLVGCLRFSWSYSFCLLSLLSFSISLCAERFSLHSFCLFSLLSFSISLSAQLFSWSYSFCFFSLISLSI